MGYGQIWWLDVSNWWSWVHSLLLVFISVLARARAHAQSWDPPPVEEIKTLDFSKWHFFLDKVSPVMSLKHSEKIHSAMC